MILPMIVTGANQPMISKVGAASDASCLLVGTFFYVNFGVETYEASFLVLQ